MKKLTVVFFAMCFVLGYGSGAVLAGDSTATGTVKPRTRQERLEAQRQAAADEFAAKQKAKALRKAGKKPPAKTKNETKTQTQTQTRKTI